MSELKLPVAAAWFFHRDAATRERRLGVLDPNHRNEPFRDVGPTDVIDRLANNGLTASAIADLFSSARPIERPTPDWDVPVDRPSKLLCLGKNFAAHAAEFGAEVPEQPLFFTKLIDTLLPAAQPVVLPHWLQSRIDHEIELGVILGFRDPDAQGRKYVPENEAMDLVAGFTILNDVTARRIQGDDRGKQQPWLRSKSFDTFCPIGPWVVPAESLAHYDRLDISLRVDDEPRQHSNTALMVVSVPAAIAYLSRHTTLRPGDVIAMGTPEGVGPIHDGQTMIGAIEDLGELRNPVVREPSPDQQS